jgi:hypothetical protein
VIFYIEHITNPMTSMKNDAEHEDEAAILSKIKLIRTEAFDQ